MRRLLIWVLGAVALLLVGYLVVANVVLMTSLGRSMASSERTRVDWDRGWSIVPSRVHLRDLHVEARGTRGVWRIDAARVDATVSPLALFAGRIHATSAEVDDVSIVAQDIDEVAPPPTADPDRAPADAPIALVRRIDGADTRTEPPPADGGESVDIDDLSATNLREVRIGPVAYHGTATARGAFRATESGSVRLEHASIELVQGKMELDDKPMLEGMRGHFTLASHSMSIDDPSTRAWLGASDAGLEMSAAVPGANAFARSEARLPGAPGTLRTSLRVVDGAFAPGSTAEVRVPATVTPTGSAPFSADVVFAVGDDAAATFTAVLHEVAWRPVDEPELVAASELSIKATSPRVRLAEPLAGAAGRLDATGLRVDPSRLPALGELVRGEPRALSGEAHLVITDGAASGHVSARAEAIDLALGDVLVGGELGIDGEIRVWHLGSGEARIAAKATHSSGATLASDDAVMRFGERPTLEATTVVHMDNAAPAIDAMTGRAKLPTLIAAIASTQSLDATARVYADSRHVTLSDIRGNVGIIHVRGRYAVGTGEVRSRTGTLLFEAGPLATGVALAGAETTLVFADARTWFDEAMTAPAPPL